MTQIPLPGQTHTAKPAPNIYTVLLVIAIVVLLVAIIFGMHTLMAASPAGYDWSFGDLFSKELPK
ncbi:MAG: hypothetical protein EHM48_07200 [Planctomycetaceae bacterium]|nr:MAG: hypothetical protein EHM48_07200 [Planctomycetaceae bacterium]